MIVQSILNAAVAASTYTLVGLSFATIYTPTRFLHFAHGAVFAAGAYLVLLLNVWLGFPFAISVLASIAITAVMGMVLEAGIYRPLRRRHSSPLVLLLVSLGLYVVLQNAISIIFGDSTRSIRISNAQGSIDIMGALMTPVQIAMVFTSAILVLALWLFLRGTRTGMAIRAVACDAELAKASGVKCDAVILFAFAVGSGLAGAAGILVAIDVDMTPTMGMNALMMGVVAVIVGGVDSIAGVAFGAILLGLAQHLGVYVVGSQWQDAIAFGLLLLFLLLRPQGLLGRRALGATV